MTNTQLVIYIVFILLVIAHTIEIHREVNILEKRIEKLEQIKWAHESYNTKKGIK